MHDVAETLAGRYRLDEPIATGAVGEVWRGADMALNRPVAVKLLRLEYALDENTLARFRAEARHAGSLSHPAITKVYDFNEGDQGNPPFLVMEYVDGESLARTLTDGPLDPDRVVDIIGQAAAGLQAAHEAGLVHRDIKPANLLIGPDWQVKITDFGIASAAWSAPVTQPGMIIGTPAYMAPERSAGHAATPSADLYSLGIVAWECLTGRQPFTGSSVEVIRAHRERPLPKLPPGVPPAVGRLVAQLTAKDLAARPSSAGQVAEQADDLRQNLTRAVPAVTAHWLDLPGDIYDQMPTGRRSPARPQPGAGRAHGKGPSRRVVIMAGGSAALVIGLTGWMLTGTSGPAPSPRSQQNPTLARGALGGVASAAPTAAQVNSAALIGQQVAAVRQQLAGLGLNVRVVWSQGSGQPSGTVVAVEPSGPVAAGSTVTVTAVTAPAVTAQPSVTAKPSQSPTRRGGGGGDN